MDGIAGMSSELEAARAESEQIREGTLAFLALADNGDPVARTKSNCKHVN